MHRMGRRLTLTAVAVVACIMLAGCGGSSGGDETGDVGGDVSAKPAAIEFVTFPSITRLQPIVDVETGEAGDTIDLEAARGEREGGQVVAWASEGAPRVIVEPTALVRNGGDRIAQTRVRAYIQQPMVVEQGSPAGRAGTYVDPLVPAAARDVVVADDERLLLWIDVDVPLDAAPGSYVGSVRIRRADGDGAAIGGDDGVLARVPVRVRVRTATIPKVPTLASHVGFDQSQLIRFEGVEAGTVELRDVTERYARELADARLSIGDVGALPPGALPGHRDLPGDPAYLVRVFDGRGVASVRIPFYLDYPFEDPLGIDRPAALRYLRASARWARAQGWADRMYVFAIDEPDESRAGEVRELHELVRAADPGLRLLVTREASARAFRGSVDIWSPNINPDRYRRADVTRELAAGRETWWYPSITTYQPFPTLFIDELRPTPRALGWLAWRHGVRGILYWTATHWHEVEDPLTDPGTYNETDAVGNGDGVLMYPGALAGLPGTPLPSVRLLQLRDGMEDHDLLALAACVATPAQRVRLRRLVTVAAPTLDRITPTEAQVTSMRAAAFELIDGAPVPAAARCRTAGQ
jgi:hypothetical protein